MNTKPGFLREASEEACERRKIILKYILRYAKTVGITTVAEGIETAEDCNTVWGWTAASGRAISTKSPSLPRSSPNAI